MHFVYLDAKWYGYNRMRFLLESLKDLNNNLTLLGGHLYILQGIPVKIFQIIKEKIGLDFITFEQVLFLLLLLLLYRY
jgi:cryptochrome